MPIYVAKRYLELVLKQLQDDQPARFETEKKRIEKGYRLAQRGGVTQTDTNIFHVESETTDEFSYVVDRGVNQCMCRDWQYRIRGTTNRCGHQWAVYFATAARELQDDDREFEKWLDELRERAVLEAQIAAAVGEVLGESDANITVRVR